MDRDSSVDSAVQRLSSVKDFGLGKFWRTSPVAAEPPKQPVRSTAHGPWHYSTIDVCCYDQAERACRFDVREQVEEDEQANVYDEQPPQQASAAAGAVVVAVVVVAPAAKDNVILSS